MGVWITGGGSGIGRALALSLAERGQAVTISGRNADALHSVARDGKGPGCIRAYPCDVTSREAVAAAVGELERASGGIELAILNAGTHVPMSAGDFRTETARELMEVNYFGVVHCLEALLPKMRERRGGHIAIVGSIAGYSGLPTAAAYGPTKAALINLCESLYPELEDWGVKLQLISPGFVETPLTARNEFPMPDMISAERAAETILKGLERSDFEIAFPWRFSRTLKLARCLPYRLYFGLVRRSVMRSSD